MRGGADETDARRSDLELLLASGWIALAIGFLAVAALLAVVLPYRNWDALAVGEWSKLIAETGHVRGFAGVGDTHYHRPLFYIGQGFLWHLFGYHEWLGRMYSLLFALILALSVFVIGRRVGGRLLAGASALVVLILSPMFAQHAAAGLTDIPAGAMVAATGAVCLVPRAGMWRLVLVAVLAACAVLAKPTALTPLLGLALAVLFVHRRELTRAIRPLVALTAGVAGGLIWDVAQARRLQEPLADFMRGGVTDYYTDRAARVRFDVLVTMDWIGAPLRALLIFSLAYAALRVGGITHRLAAWIGAGAAATGVFVGPWLATGDWDWSPLDASDALETSAQLLMVAALPFAGFLDERDAPSREWVTVLGLWALPGVAIWAAYRTDDPRLLGPAWGPLVVLMSLALWTATRGAMRVAGPSAAIAVGACVATAGAYNFVALDGLGPDGWRELRSVGVRNWFDQDKIRNIAYGPFSYELAVVESAAGANRRVITSDGRLRYFLPTRITGAYPTSCAELKGHAIFVLLLDEESSAVMESAGGSASPDAWMACRSQPMHLLDVYDGSHAVFWMQRGLPGASGNCGNVVATAGYDAVFAARAELPAALALAKRAQRAGYHSIAVERMGCEGYRVVVHGVRRPDDDIVQEAATASLTVVIEPAQVGIPVSIDTRAPGQ